MLVPVYFIKHSVLYSEYNHKYIPCITGSDDSAELEASEYYITTHYDSLEESLRIFADDELLSKPGRERLVLVGIIIIFIIILFA